MQPDATLEVHGPESLLGGKKEVKVNGTVFTEASFVS
jgi:hypothetical protein